MTMRTNDNDKKYLTELDLSGNVKEHNELLNIPNIIKQLSNPRHANKTFQAIFVQKGKNITKSNNELNNPYMWKSTDNENDEIVSEYNKLLIKYNYYEMPFRLFKIMELYEFTDKDVETRMKRFKEGIMKHADDMKFKSELSSFPIDEIKAKLSTMDSGNCKDKFEDTGACIPHYYYGPLDVPPGKTNQELSELLLESNIDYFTDETDKTDCYKWNHLRQYILGVLGKTATFENNTKYFRPEPNYMTNPSYPDITWDLDMNNVYIRCMMEFLSKNKTPPLLPVRIYADERYLDIGNERVSRYNYFTSEELDKMSYEGCILVPSIRYLIPSNKIKPSLKRYTKYKNIDIEIDFKLAKDDISLDKKLRNDLKEYGKLSIDVTSYLDYINRINEYIIKAKPDDTLTFYVDDEQIQVKRSDIIRQYNIFPFYVFKREGKKVLINMRCNRVYPGKLLEQFKFLYIEMNQMYYMNNQFNGTIHKPIKLRRYGNTNLFFFSPYDNINKLKTSFEEKSSELLGKIGDKQIVIDDTQPNILINKDIIQKFLGELNLYEMSLNTSTKSFMFHKQQVGGKSKKYMSNNINTTKNMRTKSKSINNKPNNIITSLRPSMNDNFSIELKEKNDIKYNWKITKSKKEDIFSNYPIDLLLENVHKLRNTLFEIAKYNKITVNNNSLFPKKVLDEFYNVLKSVYKYSQLGSELRSEYTLKRPLKYPHNQIEHGAYSKSNKLLMHRFIHHINTVNYIYINDNYDLLPHKFDINYKILNISHHMGYVEACIYKYLNKVHTQVLNSNIETLLVSYVFDGQYEKNKEQYMRKLYKYDNVTNIDKVWTLQDIEKHINELSGIDLCYLDIHMLLQEYKLFRINCNHMLFLGGVILALGTLNKNGNLLLSLAGLSSKFSQDIVFIIKQYFDKVILFKTETYEPHYNTYFIACYGFQNNENPNFMEDMEKMKQLYEDMYKNDSTGGLKYVPNDPKIEKQLDINHIKTDYTYYNSLLDTNDSLIYAYINEHIKERLTQYSNFLDNINFYFNNIISQKEKHNQIQTLHYFKCIQMANYLGITINPYLDIRHLQTDLINDIYRNLYGLDTTVYYRFRLYPEKIKIGYNKLQESNEYLMQQILRMDNATKVFDTRKIENYDKLKKNLRFYEKTLNILIKDEFNTSIPINNGKVLTHPSRAWIKMYEIAEVTKLIPKKAKNYKALCFCEAPGNFVLAINHFVKTKTDIENFDWVAQSYNPNANKDTRDYHVIGDVYDLMRKYPDKWDFGPKNTGDVTDSDNIKYYGSVYDDVDLLTSDCGTDWGGDDLISSKLMFGQLLFVLNNLPAGKNFVIKYYIPFIHYPAQLALFYIIYQSFHEISFYKPLQNAWSHEFYLIGKKYKKLNYDQLKPLFDIMDNYNPYMSPINLDKIPDEFMKQIEKAAKDVVDRFVFYIERYIYYLDMIEDGKNPDFNMVQKHIDIRNKEWIKEFKIQKINNKDKL